MQSEKKFRDLIKPQRLDQKDLSDDASHMNQNLVIPYCDGGYSSTSGGVSCPQSYSTNIWCITKPSEGDDLLF